MPRCPPEPAGKGWEYTMEYYSTIKANEIVPFIEIWLDLETVIE